MIRNRNVYLALAQDLASHMAIDWRRPGAHVKDCLDDCGVIQVHSPHPVWGLRFTLYPHTRDVVARLEARVAGACARWWQTQGKLKARPQVHDVLNTIGLTRDLCALATESLEKMTGMWAEVQGSLWQEPVMAARRTGAPQ